MWASFYLRNIALKFFSLGCSSFSRNNVYKKTQFSKWHILEILLSEKQKKPYYFVEQQTGRLFIVCEVYMK